MSSKLVSRGVLGFVDERRGSEALKAVRRGVLSTE